MEELINFIIAIVFIGVAVAIKLIEVFSRKKIPLPLPSRSGKPEEGFFEEIEIKPESKIEVEGLRKLKKESPAVTTTLVTPSAGLKGFTREELQNGIILSTILGPPKGLFRKFHRY